MSVKLQREDALVIRVSDLINSSVVNYGRYVTLSKDVKLDDDDELPSQSQEKIYRIFGESGLRTFLQAEINERLQRIYSFAKESRNKPLSGYPEFTKTVDVAKSVVSRLKQLPERYRLTVLMPDQFSAPLLEFVNLVRLNESVVVCRSGRSDRLPDKFSLKADNELLDEELFSDPFSEAMNTDRALPEGNLYFSSVELGCATANQNRQILDQFLNKMRSILGAASAIGMLSSNYRAKTEKKPFVIFHREDEQRLIVATAELASDVWDRRWHHSTHAFVDGLPDKARGIRSAFERVSIVLGNDEFSQRLSTACIWYYRSLASSNTLDRLLHGTIAIKVLLGDRETADAVGPTKLLGNRCAYLLGTTRASRQQIVDSFVEIYRVRSAIVHTGKHRLDRKDRNVAAACLKLCASVISKELELHHAQDLGASN